MAKWKQNNKYHNTRFSNNDGKWDSVKEYKRYLYLKDAERQGKITELKRQVKFVLIPAQYEIKTVTIKGKEKQKNDITMNTIIQQNVSIRPTKERP